MTPPEALRDLVKSTYQRLKETRVSVAVVGDLILDNAIEGVPGGTHPDIKVPILRDASSQESIGGAGNIALALSRLGVDVCVFGIIGSDLPGRQLENLLDRQPFADHLITQRGWPTPRKDWIYVREDGQVKLIRRIDYDRPLDGAAREDLVGEFRARCPDGVHAVILADHGLGCIGAESLALIGIAKERDAKVVAIPRTTVLRGQPMDAIVINPTELRKFVQASETADYQALAARYARDYGQHVFMTLQEEGVMVFAGATRGPAGTLVPGFPLERPDWMGVRDMNASIVALGLALGMDPIELGKLNSIFRHLVASQRGNGKVLWRDVFQFVGLDADGNRQ